MKVNENKNKMGKHKNYFTALYFNTCSTHLMNYYSPDTVESKSRHK